VAYFAVYFAALVDASRRLCRRYAENAVAEIFEILKAEIKNFAFNSSARSAGLIPIPGSGGGK
jgi:hypothetical protein